MGISQWLCFNYIQQYLYCTEIFMERDIQFWIFKNHVLIKQPIARAGKEVVRWYKKIIKGYLKNKLGYLLKKIFPNIGDLQLIVYETIHKNQHKNKFCKYSKKLLCW